MTEPSHNYSELKLCRPVICITGGIGAGKSVVSRILRVRGFPVYDCDMEARRIMESSVGLQRALTEAVGCNLYHSDGSLNRSQLADIIFSSVEKRREVNKLVHSAVRQDIQRWIKESSYSKVPIFFVETALPTTSRLYEDVDLIWLVEAPEELRLVRTSNRDNAAIEDVEARVIAQREEFLGLPSELTRIILNDDIHPLLPQIDKLLK